MNSNEFKVTDRQSFIQFLELFRNDLTHNKNEWANKTLEDFLEAMTRYAEDLQGYYNNTKQRNRRTLQCRQSVLENLRRYLKGSKSL